MKATVSEAVLDRARTEPERQELPPRQDALLSSRQLPGLPASRLVT